MIRVVIVDDHAVVRAGLRQAGAMSCDEAVSLMHEATVKGRNLAWKLRQQVGVGRDLAYRFDRLKSRKETQPVRPGRVQLLVDRAESTPAQVALGRATALANGHDLARDLGNLPGNICTPSYLAEAARKLATQFKLKVQGISTTADISRDEMLQAAAASNAQPDVYRFGQ